MLLFSGSLACNDILKAIWTQGSNCQFRDVSQAYQFKGHHIVSYAVPGHRCRWLQSRCVHTCCNEVDTAFACGRVTLLNYQRCAYLGQRVIVDLGDGWCEKCSFERRQVTSLFNCEAPKRCWALQPSKLQTLSW
jgi:hypothetical protein